jgi:hypothetical protein
MDWLWTWSGKCFGYRDGDDLWTYDGRHVGHFHENEIFGPNGNYLGEIKNNRLITNKNKQSRTGQSFTPDSNRDGYSKQADDTAYGMFGGFEDFPEL